MFSGFGWTRQPPGVEGRCKYIELSGSGQLTKGGPSAGEVG